MVSHSQWELSGGEVGPALCLAGWGSGQKVTFEGRALSSSRQTQGTVVRYARSSRTDVHTGQVLSGKCGATHKSVPKGTPLAGPPPRGAGLCPVCPASSGGSRGCRATSLALSGGGRSLPRVPSGHRLVLPRPERRSIKTADIVLAQGPQACPAGVPGAGFTLVLLAGARGQDTAQRSATTGPCTPGAVRQRALRGALRSRGGSGPGPRCAVCARPRLCPDGSESCELPWAGPAALPASFAGHTGAGGWRGGARAPQGDVQLFRPDLPRGPDRTV